jgi:hypothetical protein
MPSTIEGTDLDSRKTGSCIAFLHQDIRFVVDVPLHRNGLFLSLLKCEITKQRRFPLIVMEDPHRLAGALPGCLIPFLQCLCQGCGRINGKSHGSQNGAAGVIGCNMERSGYIVIVMCNAGTFRKVGKECLLRLVLHEPQSA